ncbi:MAG: WD40 repeat domain-containing protein [Phycisphaerales bacterium]
MPQAFVALGTLLIPLLTAQPPAAEPGSPPSAPQPAPDPAVEAAELYGVLIGQAWTALCSGDGDRAEALLESTKPGERGWEAAHILAWSRYAAAHPQLKPEERQGWKLVGGAQSRVSIDIDPGSRWLAFGGTDAKVHIIDLATGEEAQALHALYADAPPPAPKPPEQDRPALRSVFHAAFSADGKRLVTGAGDGGVCVFDTATWKPVARFREDAQFVSSLAVNRDASRIAVVTAGKNALLWGLDAAAQAGSPPYKQTATLGPAMNFGRPVAFTAEGKRVALGGLAACDLFDASTGERIAGAAGKLGGGSPYCMSIAFSPDGRFMATGRRGSVSKSVHLFSTGGEQVYEFMRHTKGIQGLSFSADSRRLLTTSIDGTARLLDAPTGVELLKLDTGTPVRSGVLSADGRYLALGTAEGVRLYGPPPTDGK